MVTLEQLCCRTRVETLSFTLTPTPSPDGKGRNELVITVKNPRLCCCWKTCGEKKYKGNRYLNSCFWRVKEEEKQEYRAEFWSEDFIGRTALQSTCQEQRLPHVVCWILSPSPFNMHLLFPHHRGGCPSYSKGKEQDQVSMAGVSIESTTCQMPSQCEWRQNTQQKGPLSFLSLDLSLQLLQFKYPSQSC